MFLNLRSIFFLLCICLIFNKESNGADIPFLVWSDNSKPMYWSSPTAELVINSKNMIDQVEDTGTNPKWWFTYKDINWVPVGSKIDFLKETVVYLGQFYQWYKRLEPEVSRVEQTPEKVIVHLTLKIFPQHVKAGGYKVAEVISFKNQNIGGMKLPVVVESVYDTSLITGASAPKENEIEVVDFKHELVRTPLQDLPEGGFYIGQRDELLGANTHWDNPLETVFGWSKGFLKDQVGNGYEILTYSTYLPSDNERVEIESVKHIEYAVSKDNHRLYLATVLHEVQPTGCPVVQDVVYARSFVKVQGKSVGANPLKLSADTASFKHIYRQASVCF